MSVNDINLLQAQNEGLKKQNKELQEENIKLKAENDRLKTQYNCYACGNCKGKEDYINLEKHHIGLRKQFDKKVQTLQEIKEIAETPKPFIDFSETKTATEVGYDYAVICNELELRLYKVLMLITKAEEE